MPFSDLTPQFVFPDTEWGRGKRVDFISEGGEVLRDSVALCPDFAHAQSNVYTDDDLYRDRSVPVCARRKRDGVRDYNWCCRCISGFPFVFLTKRDADGFVDDLSLTGF